MKHHLGGISTIPGKTKGSLERGKLGDPVAIDRDYLNCTEDQIQDTKPLMVMVDGRITRTN